MLLRVPDFYDSFRCIAGKCTDTCCVGWEIDIDDTSAKRYAKLEGEYGEILRKNIEDKHFKLLPGDRCPFLRRDGLCDMICHLDESSLCDICREHPRFVEVYGDIMEKGLGLCCEEAVRLLLTANGKKDSPIIFVERNTDEKPDDIPDEAIEAREAIFEEREHLFAILADQSHPLNERLVEMLDFAQETSGSDFTESDFTKPENTVCSEKNYVSKTGNTYKKILNNIHRSWFDILGKGESFGPAWDVAYKHLTQCSWDRPPQTSLYSEKDGEKIIAYQLFRYYAKSLFDGNNLTKVQFAIFFWVILQKFGDILASSTDNAPNAQIAAIKLLSKQTEYSEEIMGILEEEFMENPLFSPENFKRILTEQC